MSYMFYNCSKLTSLNLSNFNINYIKDMSYMFYKCFKLTNLNLSNFNTNNIHDNIQVLNYNIKELKSKKEL